MMRRLAIIPARGGSKGVPGKNKKILNQKPLIYYSICAAKESCMFDKVVVSTDDIEIAEIAKIYGAEVPFLRPDYLSGDNISSDEVIRHALEYYENEGEMFEYVCKLQPTSPLRTSDNIRMAIKELEASSFKAIVSVCECEHSPLWMGVLPSNLCMKDFMDKHLRETNRQELPRFYRLNGAIYISEVDEFKKNGGFIGDNTIAYVMEQERSIDIDNELDFWIAEMVMQRLRV